jgi:hypothetical protein
MIYLKPFLLQHTYTLRKILGVAVIAFLALTVKIDSLGETDEVVQFDYLTSSTHLLPEGASSLEHASSLELEH